MKNRDDQLHRQAADLLHDRHFLFLRRCIKRFPKAEAYLVGGVVRDALLGRATKDVDILIRNVPLRTLQTFLSSQGTVHLVGRSFGVLKMIPRGCKKSRPKHVACEPIDIALPRTDHAAFQSGHYRDVIVRADSILPVEDDLARRDFTINAIAYNIFTRTIVDPFGGQKDLEKKIIRTVGDPEERFAEDYSRLLRAIRFACQLGFSLEKKTVSIIQKQAAHLNKETSLSLPRGKKHVSSKERIRIVPYETIAKELIKSFSAHPLQAFDWYDRLGLFAVLMPELMAMKKCPQPKKWHSEGDVWTHTRLALQALGSTAFKRTFKSETPDALLTLAVLFHDIGKPYALRTPEKDGVDRIRFDGHDRVGAEYTNTLVERLRFSSVPEASCSSQNLSWLVKHHLLLLNTDVELLKNTTIEKYFFRDPYLGETLLKLIFADTSASVRADGGSSMATFRAFQKRLKQFSRKTAAQELLALLPPPLISGDDVMKACRLPSGPLIGKILFALREEQLSGRITNKRDAQQFVKNAASSFI